MSAEQWTVIISITGEDASQYVRDLVNDALHQGADYAACGPGWPDIDTGKLEEGWEEHTYHWAADGAAIQSAIDEVERRAEVRHWVAEALTRSGLVADNVLEPLVDLAMKESRGNPDFEHRHSGMGGLFGLHWLAFDHYRPHPDAKITDPVDNARAAIAYMQHRYGSIEKALEVIATPEKGW